MPIEPIKPGSDSRLNWKTINEILAAQSLQQNQASEQAAAIAELRRRPLDVGAGNVEVILCVEGEPVKYRIMGKVVEEE
jgi:hypothetical protein